MKDVDPSNGYEGIAGLFIKGRGSAAHGIGSSAVREWARTLPPGCRILDLGCGTGMPMSRVLIDEGMMVYGVDASPTMSETFRKNFPNAPIACESVEDSSFFNQRFDVVFAWGLIFLLSEKTQEILIQKMGSALNAGGQLLFTSPPLAIEWEDAMTGQLSRSLGSVRYTELISASGMSLLREFEDEGENHYYSARKMLD